MDTGEKVKDAFDKYRKLYGPTLTKSKAAKPGASSKKASLNSSFSKSSPSTSASTSTQSQDQDDFDRLEEKLTKDLSDHYESLSAFRKRIHDLMRREQVIQDYCDFMTDYCSITNAYYDTLTGLEDDDETDYEEDLAETDSSNISFKKDGYTFFTKDTKGVHYKSMKTEPGVPFRIEIDVKGFEPGEINIDSIENRMTITMKQKKPGLLTVPCQEKTLGIICPNVEDLDNLNIHYPKNDVLLIEGPN